MRIHLRNTSEVFHFWANQVQDRGECGNVSFNGPDVYSYSRCIATIHKSSDATLVLFDTSGYGSVTTNRHISHARSAASHLMQIDVPEGKPRRAEDHTKNLQRILRNIVDYEGKAERAKKDHMKSLWQDAALRSMRAFDAYASFFGLTERYSADAMAEMEKRVAAEAAAARERQRIADAKRREQLKDELAKWRAGTDEYVDLWGLPEVALRIHGDYVETTKHATIRIDEARQLWLVIEGYRLREREFTPGQPVGNYRLTKIRKDGSIVVGCHDIPYSEIEMIARQLGLKEEVAA